MLDTPLDEHDNWEDIMTAYTALRKPAGDAIMELALQNYIEMRDLTGDATFLKQKQLEGRLQRKYPDRWLPCTRRSRSVTSFTTKHWNEQTPATPGEGSPAHRWNDFEDDVDGGSADALAQTEHVIYMLRNLRCPEPPGPPASATRIWTTCLSRPCAPLNKAITCPQAPR